MAKNVRTIELPVAGMDCAGCARSVEQALSDVPGVRKVEVLLGAEKAMLDVDDEAGVDDHTLRDAVERAGYRVPEADTEPEVDSDPISTTGATDGATDPAATGRTEDDGANVSRRILRLFGIIFGTVLLVVVAGEILGIFDWLSRHIPWYIGSLAVVAIGYPVFRQVVRAAANRRIIAHTLMAVGALAALLAGEWVTATIVVFFMRMGDYAERFTTDQARESVRSLTRMAPRQARVIREDGERMVPVDRVQSGDVVLVRPGEQIPVDGTVLDGQATVDQSAITGESMPVEASAGEHVYAATIAQLGALRVRATAAGRDSTFGRVIQMVENAERHKGEVQRFADRFSTYYLPVVAVIAAATYLLGGGLMATVAVLVVACSCAFALATPAAILASVGAAAKHGLLIKGGKYVERLAAADVVLIDKTGTLTLGRPEIDRVIPLNGFSERELIRLGASAERHSEHPLGSAVRDLADRRGIDLEEPDSFEAVPGAGVRAQIGEHTVTVGSSAFSKDAARQMATNALSPALGTLLYVDIDGRAAGAFAASDAEREEIPEVLDMLRAMGISHLELLTGDREEVASEMAARLGIAYRAELLPEDKIDMVREYQRSGKTVVMIGDGVNDAPALAQADVGIAMGAGTDVALEAAHIALMRDDWRAVPTLFGIARRTMGVVRLNIGFTAAYNAVGLVLAAFGFLPPIYAAAAQSLPDLGIMANSARLIRQK